jgi:hypothetical protein
MMIRTPVKYRDHKLAEKTPEWPSWDLWTAWSDGQQINCYYTVIDEEIYELGNIDNPREYDLEDKRFFVHRIPHDNDGERVLIYDEPNNTTNDDELVERFADLRRFFPDLVTKSLSERED